jgi:hypothetical protein
VGEAFHFVDFVILIVNSSLNAGSLTLILSLKKALALKIILNKNITIYFFIIQP